MRSLSACLISYCLLFINFWSCRSKISYILFNPRAPKTKIFEFANSVDPDEAALKEPPHQGLHCLQSDL